VTSIFPLGGCVGDAATIDMNGWNLDKAKLAPPPKEAASRIHLVAASKGQFASNCLPFALDRLPEGLDKEANDDQAHAQEVKLPIIVNGRMDRPSDWDVFKVAGRGGETIVAEVHARRLDSPLDSFLKVTDSAGKVLAFNDDYEDLGSGLNTHHADSYLMIQLPADGTYYVHLGDTARHGGEAYAYRLRISAPQPDFALRAVPSSISLRSKSTAAVTIYAFRKDGFSGDIKLGLKDPPEGFSASVATLAANQTTARLTVKTDLVATKQPVSLVIEGRATVQDQEIVNEAVPTEDWMQAFLWRHLVPTEDLQALVYDPSYQPPPKREAPELTAEEKAKLVSGSDQPKFSKGQVAGRLRQLKSLYEEWLLTDGFYLAKVAECEASL